MISRRNKVEVGRSGRDVFEDIGVFRRGLGYQLQLAQKKADSLDRMMLADHRTSPEHLHIRPNGISVVSPRL